jgi:hypothetical protein
MGGAMPPSNRLRGISPGPGVFVRAPIDQGRVRRLAAAASLQPTTYPLSNVSERIRLHVNQHENLTMGQHNKRIKTQRVILIIQKPRLRATRQIDGRPLQKTCRVT